MPGEAALFHDPAYLKIVANAIRAGGGRAIPGARTGVQRTYMADAHPDHVSGRAGRVLRSRSPRSRLRLDGRRRGRPPLVHGAAMKEFVARLSGEIFYREDLTPALRVGTSADATLPLNRFPRSFRQCAVAHP